MTSRQSRAPTPGKGEMLSKGLPGLQSQKEKAGQALDWSRNLDWDPEDLEETKRLRPGWGLRLPLSQMGPKRWVGS